MSTTDFKTPLNAAAYATGPGQPLVVKEAPYTPPQSHELVVANRALAINPIDWIKLSPLGNLSYSWIKYPFVFGYDNAGVVVEVGSSIIRFKAGDRVVGMAGGMDEKTNKSSHSSFQKYTVMAEHMTCPIPDSMSFEEAAVIPLGASTAACELFQKDHLALEYPSLPASKKGKGKVLLVWGGSTSVGLNAIQLAVAAGYKVYATCSPRNFDLVLSVGATKAFDYASPTVIPDLIRALRDETLAGALTMGAGSADACMAILPHCKGNKFISMASFPTPTTTPKHLTTLVTIWRFLSWSVAHWFKCKRWGVKSKFIFGSSLVENEVGPLIFEQFLPRALQERSFVARPEPVVVGKGLEFVQPAFEMQKKGVSAKKVVVSL